jgi:ribonuclease J
MTQDLVEIAKNETPVAVVTEATNMTGASVSSENEVESKLSSITEQSQGILLAGFAYADVDRLNSLYRVAKKTGRCLVVSLKQAYLLNALRVDKGLKLPDLNDDNILVFRKSKKRYDKWENSILQQYSAKVADAFEVSKRQRNAILALSFYDLEELVNIKPEPGSCYVLSSSEPFNEEMEIGFEKLTNWLAHYGLSQYPVHVSGHVMPLQLRSVLKEMNPQRIFPIHTENTRLFAEFMRDLPSTIVSPEEQKEYPL